MIFLPQVILWGRTEKCLKDTCEEISMTGTECHYFVCDVGNREEVYQQAKVLREKVCLNSSCLVSRDQKIYFSQKDFTLNDAVLNS